MKLNWQTKHKSYCSAAEQFTRVCKNSQPMVRIHHYWIATMLASILLPMVIFPHLHFYPMFQKRSFVRDKECASGQYNYPLTAVIRSAMTYDCLHHASLPHPVYLGNSPLLVAAFWCLLVPFLDTPRASSYAHVGNRQQTPSTAHMATLYIHGNPMHERLIPKKASTP